MIAKIIWTKIKLFLKKYWIICVSILLGLFSFLAFLVSRPTKKQPVRIVVDNKVEETHRKLAEVEAKAVIEIGKAQGREEVVTQEIEHIKQEPSSQKRRERIAALLARG